MFKIYLTFLCIVFAWSLPAQDTEPYITKAGMVRFSSDAPLEFIEASSQELQGIIDPSKNTFVFRLETASFLGFNNPMQRAHFSENFLESGRFRTAVFAGKIIEDVNLNEDGVYAIRAKGKLEVHGVTRERIINSKVKVANGKIQLQSRFSILLEEHDIRVPKVIYQKIAEEVLVEIEAELQKQKS